MQQGADKSHHADLAAPAPVPAVGALSLATWRVVALVCGLVLAMALPFVVKNFLTFQITLAVIYAIAILGLNLLTGVNGQFSLGHSAFYAIGAYTAAIMMNADISYVWTLPVAGLACLVSGFLFGLPALRLEGIYLALATFALAVATPQLLKVNFLEDWTGGVQGISLIKPDAPFGLPLNADQWLYFFTLGVATLLYVCAANLVRSRTGRALIAIRNHPVAASAMGINVPLYKSLTFGVSALYHRPMWPPKIRSRLARLDHATGAAPVAAHGGVDEGLGGRVSPLPTRRVFFRQPPDR